MSTVLLNPETDGRIKKILWFCLFLAFVLTPFHKGEVSTEKVETRKWRSLTYYTPCSPVFLESKVVLVEESPVHAHSTHEYSSFLSGFTDLRRVTK